MSFETNIHKQIKTSKSKRELCRFCQRYMIFIFILVNFTFEDDPHSPLHRLTGLLLLVTFKLFSVEFPPKPDISLALKLLKLFGLPQLLECIAAKDGVLD